MVAAEAAAGGSLPLVARHSGLAEIAEGLGEPRFAFETGDAADLARKLRALLELPEDERRRLADAARRTVVEKWSWPSVAARLLS